MNNAHYPYYVAFRMKAQKNKFTISLKGDVAHGLREISGIAGENPVEFLGKLLNGDKRVLSFLKDINDPKTALLIQKMRPDGQVYMDTSGLLSDFEIKKAVADKQPMPVELQMKFAVSTSLATRIALAENSNLAENVQLALACDQSIQVRKALAANECIKLGTQKLLHAYGIESIDIALASNRSLQKEMQFEFLKSGYKVRMALSQNTGLVEDVQSALAEDPVGNVRCALAPNAALTEKVQLKLLNGNGIKIWYYDWGIKTRSHSDVISALMKNPGLKETLRIRLRNPLRK